MAEKYALQSEIPTKLSQLENDNKFLADSGGWQGPIPGEKVWSHTTPVSFAVLGCSAYENFHNDLSYKKSLLEGGLPSLIGGIIIWICFLLA